MSIRIAKNKLTGRQVWSQEVVLGYRQHGTPGVTVHFNDGYGCFVEPAKLEELIADLQLGLEHLRGSKNLP